MPVTIERLKEVLTAKAYKDFSEFMSGQTVRTEKGKVTVFDYDFLRWLEKKQVID